MVTVTKKFKFEACHYLPNYVGKCHNLHGHSYRLEVTIGGEPISDTKNPKVGMIIDFKDLKKMVNEYVVDKYDHSFLNEDFKNPTAELMVESIGKTLEYVLSNNSLTGTEYEGRDLKLVSVKLWETEDSYAEYIPDKEVM